MAPSISFIVLLLVTVYLGPSLSLPLRENAKSGSGESDSQLRTNRQASNMQVIAREMPIEMENDMIKITKEVLTKYGSDHARVSEIGRKMDAKYGPHWQVFSYPANTNIGTARHAKQHILLEMNGETRVLIYLSGTKS